MFKPFHIINCPKYDKMRLFCLFLLTIHIDSNCNLLTFVYLNFNEFVQLTILYIVKNICLERMMVKVICMYASGFLFDSFNVRSFHSKLCFICWKSNTSNILWHSLSYIYVKFEQLYMRTFGASVINTFCVISTVQLYKNQVFDVSLTFVF